MNGTHRIRARLLVIAAAAALTLSMPVIAQVPGPSPGTPGSGPSVESVNLTMEQRHVIKELIVKDMKIAPPADQAARVPTDVGAVVPSGVPLQPMPVEVSAKVPQLKAHSFIVRDGKVVIVDPKDNRVAALVE
jgi:uncharacterized protein DUF1236